MSDWQGKSVLITGGSSGIGRATAALFAERGANVVIGARDTERGEQAAQELRGEGGRVEFIATDVTDSDSVKALVARTVGLFGRLDAAVNNAGFAGKNFVPISQVEEREFDQVIAVNLKGVWLGMKHQIPQMLSQQPAGGAIVNTSSLNGLGGAPMASPYSAGKAGVLALSKCAAQEFGTQGIRVNALAAGAFDTPMLNEAMQKASELAGQPVEQLHQRYVGMIPMQRIGRPEEAAEAIVWLCSDAASYVTGHSMIVDGGWSSPTR